MAYIGSSVNTSPTIVGNATTAIQNGAGKAVKFDASGGIVVCGTAGEAAVGFLILQTAGEVAAGESVTVQTCCKGKAIAGAAVAAGDMLSVDASGKVVKATTGFLVGQALSAATKDGFVDIEIIKGGIAGAASAG